MVRRVALVALACVLGACGGGGAGKKAAETPTSVTAGSRTPATTETAEAAFRRQLQRLSDGQYGRQWEELHPAQQAFIPKELFVRCIGERIGNADVTGVTIKSTFAERLTVPGTGEQADSTAITAEVAVKAGKLEQKSTDTYHEFLVGGQWKWTASGDVDAYKRGACPASS
jgi:hypothetical protein